MLNEVDAEARMFGCRFSICRKHSRARGQVSKVAMMDPPKLREKRESTANECEDVANDGRREECSQWCRFTARSVMEVPCVLLLGAMKLVACHCAECELCVT